MNELTLNDFLNDYSRLVIRGDTDAIPVLIEDYYSHIADDCQFMVDSCYVARAAIQVDWKLYGKKKAMETLAALKSLPAYTELLAEFKSHINANYDKFDVFVECFTELELRQFFEKNGATTLDDAIKLATEYVELCEGRDSPLS